MNQFGYGSTDRTSKMFNGHKLTSDISDADLISEIESRWTSFSTDTRRVRRQWLINSAFTRSQQFAVLHKTDDRLIYPQEPSGRKQVTMDLIGPWKEHMIGNLVTVTPKFEAIPSNTDADAASAARLGTALLNHYWDSWKFIESFIELASYLIDFGNAFVFLNYKEDSSRYISRQVIDANTGLPAVDGEGNYITERTAVGDIHQQILMPQNICTTLDSTPLKKKPWIEVVQRRHIDYFAEQYGKKGEEVKAESIRFQDFYDIERISNTNSDYNNNNVEYANEKIYMQKPCEKNPDGMVAVVANGVLLYRDVWPYEKMLDYPIIHFHMMREPGEFFARSWLERQIPIQKLYNLIWSILAENADDMAHLKWLIPNQSGVDTPTDMVDVIRYLAPFKPEQSDVKPMPNYITDMLSRIRMEMENAQNYHGASQGGSVSGVRSMAHAENLQQQDLLPLTVIDNMMQIRYEEMGEMVLAIASEKLTDERLISYTGEDKRMMLENFRGTMLGDTTKVKCRMANAWARNKSAAANYLIQSYQMGAIVDELTGKPDPIKFHRSMEFVLPDAVYQDQQKHTELAYVENDRMMTGQPVWVLPWQNHRMHLSVLRDFMNSTKFIELFDDLEGNKEIIDRFVTHLQQHEQIIMQAMRGLAPTEQQGGAKDGGGQQQTPAKREQDKAERP